jgi:UTP--glucose-1-phosphate uridylyltransferase
MIGKAVIPSAGLGTRLLPITKELPKEMLPVFFKGKDGAIHLKPMLQAVFEQLFDVGVREFCFVVGRGKRAIEDHFTPDDEFVGYLNGKSKNGVANELHELYQKIDDSNIVFVNQPKAKGFGDAIHRAKPFTGGERFFVHAGDDYVFSSRGTHLRRIAEAQSVYDADAVLLVEQVRDPRMYGVIVGEQIGSRLYKVTEVVEKPDKPPTNLAAIAISAYNSTIHEALEKIAPDENDEIQLTAAVQQLIKEGQRICAVELEPCERRIDIGGPERYCESLKISLEALDDQRFSNAHVRGESG